MKKVLQILAVTMVVGIFASLSFAGDMSQKKLSLKKGWNLIGGVLNNVQIQKAFTKEIISSMWKWNSDNSTWEIFSPDNNVQKLLDKYQLKKFSKMNSGEGYWVNAKSSGTLYLNGYTPQMTPTMSSSAVDMDFSKNIDAIDNESITMPDKVKSLISQLITNAEIVNYSGEVINVPQIGIKTMNGFQLKTEEGEVTIYGLGPLKIWENADVERPVVGDNITVEAFKIVTDNNTVRNIAIKVTDSDGNTLDLRDVITGLPLWAKGKIGFNKDSETGKMKKLQYKWGKKFKNTMGKMGDM